MALAAAAMLTLAGGCGETYLDRIWTANVEHEDAIKDAERRTERLQALCDSLNDAAATLQALIKAIDGMDYITDIAPVIRDGDTVGFDIKFKYGDSVTIMNGRDGKNGADGADAEAPEIGITMTDDGRYCWTVNGEIIRDPSGNPVYVEGTDAVTPLFKTEDGVWRVSYDDGKSYISAGQADGGHGDPIFREIAVSDDAVNFILSDGTELTIPRYREIRINFDMEGDESGIEAGRSIQIGYSLSYADSATLITSASDGNYKVKIEKANLTDGRILITGPKHYEDGHVTFIVSDGAGHTFSRVINFYERQISFPSGMIFTVPAKGSTVQIPVNTNFEYEILHLDGTSQEWIDFDVRTRASVTSYVITLDVKMNKDFSARSAELGLFAKNEPDNPLRKIVITQSAAEFDLSQNRFMLDAEEKAFTVHIKSTLGLKIVQDGATWLRYGLTGYDDVYYRLDFTADANASDSRRSSSLELLSADGSVALGKINVTQIAEGEENPDNMIFRVRATYANDFSTKLPLGGTVDCTVDWGDGSEPERIRSVSPSHTYPSAIADYIVKISGTVTSLHSYSNDMTAPSITEVIQWGLTGLTDMSNAFLNNTLLEKIPDDINGAFVSVENMDNAFTHCSRLKAIPDGLFSFCNKLTRLYATFQKCISIETVPGGLFAELRNLTSIDNLFDGCTGITTIPEELFANNSKLESFNTVFGSCSSLKAIPERLLYNCTEIRSFTSSFSYCSSLESIPADLFSYCPKANNFWQTFCCCHALAGKELPHGLFDNNRKIRHFQEVFFACGLTGESPYTTIDGRKVHMYERNSEPDWFFPIANIYYNRSYVGNYFTDSEQIPTSWKY